MQRAAWTDERLDDLAYRMDAGFARVDADIRELRGEMGGMRAELRGEIADLRVTMNRFGTGLLLAMAGLIAAQLYG